MNPTNIFTVALLGLQLFSSVAFGASSKTERGNSLNNNAEMSTLKTCIDDSDCKNLPDGPFRCFVYICYPWKDDSAVPDKEKRESCRKDKDCKKPNQECVRHTDKRNVNTGLCFDEIQDCSTPKDCENGYGCCSEYCCEPHYFNEYRKLPCPNHLMCQDLGLGDFCCPTDNNSTICCDTDPNPKPTQAPSVGDSGSSSPVVANNFKMALGMTMAISYLLSKMI